MKDEKKPENAADDIAKLSFEEGLKSLESLVQSVESGTLPLDAAVVSYERGVALVQQLRGQLTTAEAKLRILQKDGTPVEG